MPGIARQRERDGARRGEARQPLDERLRTGRGDDRGALRHAIGDAGGGEEASILLRAGQPLPAGSAERLGDGPRMGVDAGRKVEPGRIARAVARPRLRQIAAMLHGLRFARGSRFRKASFLLAGLALLPGAAESAGPRVVSINLCVDQLIVPLADPDQILGLSPYARDRQRSGVAEAAARFPLLSGTAEEVLALKPDLVLSGRFTKRATREILKSHGARLVELDAVRSLGEAKAQLREIGRLLGHPDRAEAAVARIEAAAERTRAVAPGHLVVLPLQRRGWVAGAGTLLGSLLQEAGLVPGIQGRGLGRFMTLEEIVARRPDLLVVSEAGESAEDQGSALLLHPALATLYPPERRIVLPDSLNLFCGGPALADALDRLATEIRRAVPR